MFSLFYSIFSTTTNSFSPPLKILNSSKNPRNIEGGNALFMDVLLEESTEEIVLNDAELQFYGLIRRHLVCFFWNFNLKNFFYSDMPYSFHIFLCNKLLFDKIYKDSI